MKKLVIGVAVVFVLLIGLILAAPFVATTFIPAETYKQQIAQAAREATGRELTIAGDLNLSILPRFELEANDVAFSNAPGASRPEMARLKQLLVQLQVLPLLAFEVKVDSFVLVEPVIHLEVDKQGRANWQFAAAPEAEAEAAAAQDQDQAAATSGLQEISLGEVRLDNGRLTYNDAQNGQALELTDINMKLSLPDLDSPFAAEGSVVWNDEQMTLKVDSDKLRRLLAGETTPLELAVQSRPVNLAYVGEVMLGEPLRVGGKLDLDVPSIRDLADWTGNPIEAEGSGLGPLKIKGRVEVTGPKYAFTEATIALDEMNAMGDFLADTGGAKPILKGRLNVDLLDLNPYLPPPAKKKEASGGTETAEAGAAPADWSDEPLNLSGLKAANADFDLEVGGIRAQEVKIGKSALTVSLKDGLLVADLKQLDLYDGSGTGKITLDARGKVPSVKKSFAITGVSAEPLLTDAAGFGRLEGTGRFEIAITAKGRSQRAMVQALNGTGAVTFTDGAIKGVNLAAMARNVKSAFLDSGAEETQKTDFAELSGTFKIDKGILTNNDLKLLNPLIRLAGAGTADMPKRLLDYRLEPKLVGTLKGQGGKADAKGIVVPVIVEGAWHDLKYRPDLASLVGDVAKDPAKALGAAKDTAKGAKGAIGEVLKGAKPPEGEEGGSGLLDPSKTFKKLFGN